MGLTVPLCRRISKKYVHLSQEDVLFLLQSKFHEERLIALYLLIEHYKKTKDKRIIKAYLHNAKYVNNWDLIDSSSYQLLGEYLRNEVKDEDQIKKILLKLAKSKHMWSQRIAMISTFSFIKKMSRTTLRYAIEKFHPEERAIMLRLGK